MRTTTTNDLRDVRARFEQVDADRSAASFAQRAARTCVHCLTGGRRSIRVAFAQGGVAPGASADGVRGDQPDTHRRAPLPQPAPVVLAELRVLVDEPPVAAFQGTDGGGGNGTGRAVYRSTLSDGEVTVGYRETLARSAIDIDEERSIARRPCNVDCALPSGRT
jgi:hypothetical protein